MQGRIIESGKQVTLWDILQPYRIRTPVRLIELFGGIGSQAMAFRELGVPFEHYRLVEYDRYPVASYNAIHGTGFKPVDIRQIHGADLGIVEPWDHTYFMTYSFPCQDLSVAGKGAGMAKGSGTRSGLLWEVERLLEETEFLPHVLLMENVPQVHNRKNMPDFQRWLDFLSGKGYQNFWQDLNAKDFGVAQNRVRCFCVSILGGGSFSFPDPIPLSRSVDDYLEDVVDAKYYLRGEKIRRLTDTLITGGMIPQTDKSPGKQFLYDFYNDRVIGGSMCMTITASGNISSTHCGTYGVIHIKQDTIQGYVECRLGGIADFSFPSSGSRRGRVVDGGNASPCITACIAKHTGLCRIECGIRDFCPLVYSDGEYVYYIRIRKLIPLECWRLMGFSDEDFLKAAAVNSNTQLYKQAGNSIVKNVLVAIIGQMFEGYGDIYKNR